MAEANFVFTEHYGGIILIMIGLTLVNYHLLAREKGLIKSHYNLILVRQNTSEPQHKEQSQKQLSTSYMHLVF
jgi:hypothetical protein